MSCSGFPTVSEMVRAAKKDTSPAARMYPRRASRCPGGPCLESPWRRTRWVGSRKDRKVVNDTLSQTGEQEADVGRLGVMLADFPVTVPAVTLNRMCGSRKALATLRAPMPAFLSLLPVD